ncbi:MAG: hypothetical protein HY735_03205 [Verrucomicrobia bacterium]|nr:hypothetical protein [Verrucomicrobiota bacterium]
MHVRDFPFFATIIVITVVLLVILVPLAGRPRVVQCVVTPAGVEMCVRQKCNWGLEGWFTTDFVYRKPGSAWGWFYYDHQDSSRWRSNKVTIDTNANVAVFYRNGVPAITFAWETETFTLHRMNRTLVGPQARNPPGWEP